MVISYAQRLVCREQSRAHEHCFLFAASNLAFERGGMTSIKQATAVSLELLFATTKLSAADSIGADNDIRPNLEDFG